MFCVFGKANSPRSNRLSGLAAGDTIRFAEIAVGGRHSCALDADGVAHCWGYSVNGQTGLASTELPFRPRPLLSALRFSKIVAGSQSTCAIERDAGDVYCWGSWEFAKLGIPSAYLGMDNIGDEPIVFPPVSVTIVKIPPEVQAEAGEPGAEP